MMSCRPVLVDLPKDRGPMMDHSVAPITAGDGWLEKGANLLLFGPPGAGKSHLAAAIGLALVKQSNT